MYETEKSENRRSERSDQKNNKNVLQRRESSNKPQNKTISKKQTNLESEVSYITVSTWHLKWYEKNINNNNTHLIIIKTVIFQRNQKIFRTIQH